MHFLTPSECSEWDALRPRPGAFHAKVAIPRDCTASLRFCQSVERAMRPYRACLLWFTETDIWHSSTNWHLYYRLRQSYGDHRRVEDAPGQVFLDDEAADFVSFFQIAVLAGFDAHLITDPTGYSRAFLSHDEFVEFSADEGNEELVKEFVSLTSP
ncbi:MAG TPA: hypothetical protein VNV25_08015 [Gemmatimonadaceae bacterium]|jgi:hypothetical protein|nr:hypothetical protein [Gemmatimonadaceae bacterium]